MRHRTPGSEWARSAASWRCRTDSWVSCRPLVLACTTHLEAAVGHAAVREGRHRACWGVQPLGWRKVQEEQHAASEVLERAGRSVAPAPQPPRSVSCAGVGRWQHLAAGRVGKAVGGGRSRLLRQAARERRGMRCLCRTPTDSTSVLLMRGHMACSMVISCMFSGLQDV